MEPRRRVMLIVAGAQLAAGLAGMVTAIRREYAYDVFWMHGRANNVRRESILFGTAMSPPVWMLACQAALIVALAQGGTRRFEPALGGLGAAIVGGYLGERLVRERLAPGGWHPLESPLLLAGIGLASAMAVLGLRQIGLARAALASVAPVLPARVCPAS